MKIAGPLRIYPYPQIELLRKIKKRLSSAQVIDEPAVVQAAFGDDTPDQPFPPESRLFMFASMSCKTLQALPLAAAHVGQVSAHVAGTVIGRIGAPPGGMAG